MLRFMKYFIYDVKNSREKLTDKELIIYLRNIALNQLLFALCY